MTDARWHTPEALAWMLTILQERFGHAFALQPQADDRRIMIRIEGDAHCVTLALNDRAFTHAGADLPCAQWNSDLEDWAPAIYSHLPAPGAALISKPLIIPIENGWHIDYDILGLTYWMLTRQEEVARTDLDKHGRFPATASHAYRYGYLERPIVDEWLDILGQVIKRTWPTIILKQHQFTMRVSHDVDSPSRYGFCSWPSLVRRMGGDLLKHGDMLNALRAPWIRLHARKAIHRWDPYNTFDWLMDLSDRNGITSAFYFICGHTSNYDADYEPDHPAIISLMQGIHRRGHEIGLHPSYGTYQTPQLIRQEADGLRRIAEQAGIQQSEWGGRMHYLRWEQPTTLRAWADAGMTYDSTLCYADRPGFRCGTCFEYQAFDPVSRVQLPLRIRPLVVMEGSVFDASYLGLGVTETAQIKMLEFKETCRKVNGCFTLLWHNSSFQTPRQFSMYEILLK